MDVILGNENTNPIERDLSDVFGNSKTIVTWGQNHSSEEIIPREMISGNMAMEIRFQGKVGSRKQWKLLLVNLIRNFLRRWTQ